MTEYYEVDRIKIDDASLLVDKKTNDRVIPNGEGNDGVKMDASGGCECDSSGASGSTEEEISQKLSF
ncbi:hypothetical protein ECG_02547 [Echinococcus granulosus]|uniref:Protoscolex specific coiled coil protein n=1 Tax=Echinococcus granulosus TaxID=6210 RepID=A0A068WV91_ECHGR|nr:hypothetical protein ECG_02547 [Echinococcus granulosus]CDS21545.1 protoscolex specific coiled coil protein [Echinococcus granulosus]